MMRSSKYRKREEKVKMDNEKMIYIDEKKAERLLKKIIIMEKQNLRTKQYNDAEMVRRIKKAIEEEVECF